MAEATSKLRIALIIVLLGLTTGFCQIWQGRQFSVDQQSTGQPSLEESFMNLPGWPGLAPIPLSETIVQELKLDDYLYRSYGNLDHQLALYIGYYCYASKVGAAHDPLVCFQGQGWRISSRDSGRHRITGTLGLQVAYATMIAERENNKELIVYWFQTDARTSNNTLSQKLDMIWQRFTRGNENNAFVRINAQIKDASPQAVRQMIFDFIDQLYPQFHAYMTRG